MTAPSDSPAPPPLPYDPGNAGDLLKHGLLAEVAAWWCREGATLRFLDPFGGPPWTAPRHPVADRRLLDLTGTALAAAQDDPRRYLGSGHLVLRATRAAEVLAGDREPTIRRRQRDSGLGALEAPGYTPTDGYSILDAAVTADLVLLDPFADFLAGPAPAVLPRAAAVARRMAVVLFVPLPEASAARWRALRDQHLPGAWRLGTAATATPAMRGEAAAAEVLLAAPWQDSPEAAPLAMRLEGLAGRLSGVLARPVQFATPTR